MDDHNHRRGSRIALLALCGVLSLSALPFYVYAVENTRSLVDAVQGGDFSLRFRYRLEVVDQEGIQRNAKASTLRTRLAYQSLAYHHFSTHIEFDNLLTIVANDYNDTFNRKPFPVVADPTYSEFNQAYLDFSRLPDTVIRFGKQRINLNNERFVGGVGWRQNEQTFDALTVINTGIPNTTVFLSDVINVNTIRDTNMRGHHQLLNITTQAIPFANFTLYGYLLNNLSDTYGFRLTQGAGKHNFIYTLEYADQKTEKSSYDAKYLLLEGGVKLAAEKIPPVTVKLSYEKLSSDSGQYGFQTDLATKHPFNGWADKFLTTPDNGLLDRYLSVSTKIMGTSITGVYHDFESDKNSIDLGSEIDIIVKRKLHDALAVALKYAKYEAGGVVSITDTSKLWLMFNFSFLDN